MNYLTIEEIHAALLEVLVEFDRVCTENGLRYSLAYGTLLGAIRHKGFIPWDDDVDVIMPRPDYEKLHELLALGKANLGEDFGYSEDRGSKAEYPFVKLMHKGYTVKSTTHIEVPYLWIDVFPADGMPETEKARKKLDKREKFHVFSVVISRWFCPADNFAGKVLRVLGSPFYLLWRLIFGRRRAIKRINRIATAIPFEGSTLCDCVCWGPIRAYMPTHYFDELTTTDFEGHRFSVFSAWDEFLTMRYGDYMTPPPENKRETHSLIVYKSV